MDLNQLRIFLDFLTPEERYELSRLAADIKTPLWTPFPGPQTAAVNSQADILGFGGSAGGGKSDLLLGIALTQHTRSIIFRREALQGRGLMDRLNEITGGVGRLNENLGVWRDGVRQIEFAGVKDVGDEQRYKGRPHDLLCFDEGDFFLESQFRFLMGWLRTTDPKQRCRAIICFNPPNSAEGRWVIQFFAPWLDRKHPNPAEPGELRWYATLPDRKLEKNEIERPNGEPFEYYNESLKRYEVIRPTSRTFIPSRVTDNPALMATGYVQALQAMPEPFRSQLLYGDFNISQKDDPYQVIPTAWVEAAQERWKPEDKEKYKLTAIGVDPSRGGTDSTTISRRHRTWFDRFIQLRGEDTDDGPKVRDAVMMAIDGRPNVNINIDVIGVGASAHDALVEIGSKQFKVTAVNFSESAPGMDRTGLLNFVNMRAWAYWYLRECLDPKDGDNLALPPDPELLADLTAAKWCMRPGGVLVEPKEDIKKRIGRSPDKADALVYANIIIPGIEYTGLLLG